MVPTQSFSVEKQHLINQHTTISNQQGISCQLSIPGTLVQCLIQYCLSRQQSTKSCSYWLQSVAPLNKLLAHVVMQAAMSFWAQRHQQLLIFREKSLLLLRIVLAFALKVSNFVSTGPLVVRQLPGKLVNLFPTNQVWTLILLWLFSTWYINSGQTNAI